MSLGLEQILQLVGNLDDTPGDDTPSRRFQRYVQQNVGEVGQLADLVAECLRKPVPQFSRALQDLVNRLGGLLGFEVEYGRYQGTQKEIGFDGLWSSPTGFHVVVEAKTSDRTYVINTAPLSRYMVELVSEGKIPTDEHALGLYVVGRRDPETRQLENAIEAEKRGHRLRVISVESLLDIADAMERRDIVHRDVLTILRPAGASIDPFVDLMKRILAGTEGTGGSAEAPERAVEEEPELDRTTEPSYWLTPVRSDEHRSAEETIRELVGEGQLYAVGERTPGRRHFKPGDRICFYATTVGVLAHARVKSSPAKRTDKRIRDPERYPWVFDLEEPSLYVDNPVVIDASLRTRLEAFEGRDPNQTWAWFVQATRRVSTHDFKSLTRP